MQLKKVLGWAVVFLAWCLFIKPQAAGNAAHNRLNLLTQARNSIATFLQSL